MKKLNRNTVLATLLFLSVTVSASAQESVRSQSSPLTFRCSEGKTFRANFFNDRALVRLDNGQVAFMQQVESGSGVRYQSGNRVLLSKGNEAMILENDQPIYQDCKTEMTSSTAIATVTGTVFYRERIALPPDAIVKVKLLDTSRIDAPAITLAEQTIQGKQVPIPFRLEYDPTKITERNTYVVRAEIYFGDRLRFTSDTAYPVITNGSPSQVDVLVRSAGSAR